MMDIEKRILHLLYFKDCVIIPGLGGFVSNYVPARIREESQTFIPPAKEIGFNRELLLDDRVLSGYLVKCDKISNDEAVARIDKYVSYILNELTVNGSYSLKPIGEFSYARTGELVFKAAGEVNFLIDSYGLSSFYYIRLEKGKENPLLRSAIFKHGDKIRTVPLPGTQIRTERQKSIRRVAIALPLLIVISLLPLNSRNGFKKQQNNAGFIPSLSVVEMPDAKSESGAESNVYTSFEGLTPEEKSSDRATQHEPFDKSSYAIVAGSFSSESNAEVLRDELIKKGYGPEVWKASNGFFRVIIQAHDEMLDAQNAVAELKKELSGIEFWILQ